MSRLVEALLRRVVLGDGAMGTELLKRPERPPGSPADLNLLRPDLVLGVHRAHVEAGAELVRTNTFTANRQAAGDRVRELNRAGARLAREAAGAGRLVAGSAGPVGPGVSPGEAEGMFEEQCGALAEGGCDGIVLETFSRAGELRVAAAAARRTGLPVVALACGEFARLAKVEADVLGVNCVDPGAAVRAIESLAPGRPLAAFPSAGLPPYPATPEVFAEAGARLAGRGVRLLGGCCGTTPEHIRALAARLEGERRTRPQFPLTVRFRGGQEVVLESPREPETELEFFDSDNSAEGAVVVDAAGRRVRLKVEACAFKVCELAGDKPGGGGG